MSSSYKPISDEPATVDLRSTIELPVENHAFVKVLDLDINKHTTYQNIDFDFVYTSFIFEISRDADFVSTTYTTKEKRCFTWIQFHKPISRATKEGHRLLFPIPPKSILISILEILKGALESTCFMRHLFCQLTSNKLFGQKIWHQKLCDKASSSLAEDAIWRDGLPDPTGKPNENHAVNHSVIHHAASSNTPTTIT